MKKQKKVAEKIYRLIILLMRIQRSNIHLVRSKNKVKLDINQVKRRNIKEMTIEKKQIQLTKEFNIMKKKKKKKTK